MWLIRQWFAVGLALTCSTGCGSSTPDAFNGSVHEDIAFGEGGQSTKTGGQVVVWDARGPRLLSEELGALVPETMTWETERPLLITHTKSAIVVIGTSPSYGWRAVLPLR